MRGIEPLSKHSPTIQFLQFSSSYTASLDEQNNLQGASLSFGKRTWLFVLPIFLYKVETAIRSEITASGCKD